MRRVSVRILLALMLGAAAPPAFAQDAAPFRASLGQLVILPGGDRVGEEREVPVDTPVLTTRIGFSGVAVVAAPPTLMLAGQTIALQHAGLLTEATPDRRTRARIGETARVFCDTTRRAVITRQDRNDPRGARVDRDITPCLVDSDGDRRFDHAFLIGARWGSDRVLVPIEPVGFTLRDNYPAPNSTLTVNFRRGAPLQGAILKAEVIFLGRSIGASDLRLGAARQSFSAERGIGRNTYPHVIAYGAAQIAILGYDRDRRVVRLRVDHAFELASLDFEFPGPNIIMIYH